MHIRRIELNIEKGLWDFLCLLLFLAILEKIGKNLIVILAVLISLILQTNIITKSSTSFTL